MKKITLLLQRTDRTRVRGKDRHHATKRECPAEEDFEEVKKIFRNIEKVPIKMRFQRLIE